MSTLNLLVAFNSNQIEGFYDNFRFNRTPDPDGGSDIYTRVRTDFAPFLTDGERPVTLDPYNRDHLNVNVQAAGSWKPYIQGGPVTTILASMNLIDTPDFEDKVAMASYLRDQFPSRFQIMGLWHSGVEPEFVTSTDPKTVVMHGQTITRATYDENGDELTPETVDGTSTYPLNPNYLKWMPDDVTYDDAEPPNETSRADATEFKQVHKTASHPDRLV